MRKGTDVDCQVCGAPLLDGALFCGECGSSVTASRRRREDLEDHRSRDTVLVPPVPRPQHAPLLQSRTRAQEASLAEENGPRAGDGGSGALSRSAGSALPAGGSGPLPHDPSSAASMSSAAPLASPTAVTLRLPSGGQVLIQGATLLGRRPSPGAGEAFDALVTIEDPGRSVSKTHLELGLEGEELWVCDRFSANGTVLRPPGGRARLCEPGRRYRVGHGTRIEIGEQYLDVD